MLKRIFPKEEYTDEAIQKHIKRLAIKDVCLDDTHFAPVVPLQEKAQEHGRYTSEKIVPSPAKQGNPAEPYATFRKMRTLGVTYSGYGDYNAGDAETFCAQAVFMQDFTDDYGEIAPLDAYYTTYVKMDDAQLRTYFSWRTRVRRGIVEKVSVSYAFCYLYELLNDIGVHDPDDAMEKMIALWTEFRQFENALDRHLPAWLRDYYVTHRTQLPAEFAAYSHRFPVAYFSYDIQSLERAKACPWDDLRVMEASSSFKITNGQFYKTGTQDIIEQCACFTMGEIAKAFKRGGVDVRKLFFEKRRERLYTLYHGAVHQRVAADTVVVELGCYEIIKHNSRGWYREYASITQYKPVVGYLLKLMEVEMRQHFGYKNQLQEPPISVVKNSFLSSEPERYYGSSAPTMSRLKPWKDQALSIISDDAFQPLIVRAIADYCKQAHIAIRDGALSVVAPVKIDMSKLKAIERDHLETAKKLILEEPPAPQPELPVPILTTPVVAAETKDMAWLWNSLPPACQSLLRTLLEGGQAPPNSELMVEQINETALEAMDDSLIDYADGMPYLYDEYMDELRLALGGP